MSTGPAQWEGPGDERWRLNLGDGLYVLGTDSPHSLLLERFYEGYDKAFIIPSEREELEGFVKCLSLNSTLARKSERRFRELIFVLHGENHNVLGGANFLAVEHLGRTPHPRVSVNLNYLFVDGAARGRGLSRAMLGAVTSLACRGIGVSESEAAVIFIEQNDPIRLSSADYAADTAHSGMDQIERLAVWAKLGAKVVDIDYRQPPLSSSQATNDGLIYAAINLPGANMDACYLHDHLYAFFEISVFKGQDPCESPIANPQLERLAALCRGAERIRLLDPWPALHYLRGQRDMSDFRDFLDLSRKLASMK